MIENEAPTPNAAPEATATPTVDLTPEVISAAENKWAKHGALIVCDGGAPKKTDGRGVIVIQTREREEKGTVATGEVDKDGPVLEEAEYGHRNPSAVPPFKKHRYIHTGDLYLRFDDTIDFTLPKNTTAKVLTLGVDIQQGDFSGLSEKKTELAVAGASPAYAAVNLAVHMGANDIVLDGLSDDEKVALAPLFGALENDKQLLERLGLEKLHIEIR